MSNYLYFQHEDQLLNDRFNVDGFFGDGYVINGLGDWRRLISLLINFLRNESDNNRQNIRIRTLIELIELSGNDNFNIYNQDISDSYNRTTEELIAILLLIRLKRLNNPASKNRCPRLFISHRKIDKDYALRIAELAGQNGFAYWIDVLDPNLQILANSTVPQLLISIVTACIIEMALINCTHIIACMTLNSRGTLWIPYEYGRITELQNISVNACAWLHPSLPQTDFPEYMLLGGITVNETGIEYWLRNESGKWNKNYCKPDIIDLSSFGKVNRLPE